jgi:hypothetical protein
MPSEKHKVGTISAKKCIFVSSKKIFFTIPQLFVKNYFWEPFFYENIEKNSLG